MRLLFLSIISLCFVACTTNSTVQDCPDSPEKFTPTAEDQEALRYLKEVEWPKAYREQDTVLLDRILGDDFQMIDSEGNSVTKQNELDWIKENVYKPDSFYYEIKRFEFLENGTAVISGTGHISKGGKQSIYQSSNMLIKRKGIWKAFSSHVSGVKELP